ncbi:Carbonic anhydrase [Geoglobus ahangari]|uniref:Carbonic anhydrase n=1 Tax=Geoglobus ahangari TaxID=113653 RepID=A0A0F7IE87_9EURY|nr:gamma carbonic anhydrase family protein [Geoglobus ahangari]AKG90998.1 Carbonic anhydrase [Geoglobus ahangari]
MRKGERVFIADTAVIKGDVEIGDDSSVWFNAVIRGDLDKVVIGRRTNVQDNAVIHVDEGFPTVVGDNVTIGHSAVVHGCRISDNVLVGMNAVVLNGAEIGEYSIVGAGAVVTGKKFPERSLILGVPAKVVREITDQEMELIERSWKEYLKLKDRYLSNTL